jgi:hypothetical protein
MLTDGLHFFQVLIMKFFRYLVLLASLSSTRLTAAFVVSGTRRHGRIRSTCLHYSERSPGANDEVDAWQVLAQTERWISETSQQYDLDQYARRKQVTYACETATHPVAAVASIWTRLCQAREAAQDHVQQQKEDGTTLRQTQVICLPAVATFASFGRFHDVMEGINQARRQARDYAAPRPADHDPNWSISVNCAHLHPQFGLDNSSSHDNDDDDEKYREYQQKKQLARQSPHPTIVLEVRAIPTAPDFGMSGSNSSPNQVSEQDRDLLWKIRNPDAATDAEEDDDEEDVDEPQVTSTDVSKLEALFGSAAAQLSSTAEPSSTWEQTKEWIYATQKFVETSDVIQSSSTTQVDEAYEFVFGEITNALLPAPQPHGPSRLFLVLPQFLTTAATSFEKFAGHVSGILFAAGESAVAVHIVHPEHVNANQRAPAPVLVISFADRDGLPLQ